jgi:predicted Zn-dependent protease
MSSRSSLLSRAGRVLVGCVATLSLLTAPARVYAQSDQQPSLVRDTEIEEILREDADPVFRAAGLNPHDVNIHLVGSSELNAFAAGGQNLFLHTGLIIETNSPNQLIGVIAHETGHIAGGHIARSGAATRAAMGPMLLGMGLGILAAIAGAPDAAAGLIYSSTYFAQISVLGYSREQESAADQAAITYLERSGQSARGLVEFFDNFRFEEVMSEDRRFPFFRDHPLSSDRIEALRARAQEQPHWSQTDSAEAIARHAIMKAKLEGFLNPPMQTLAEYPETDHSYPARYARAIAYYRATETEHALHAVDALITEQPNNPYLWELKGQILFESGRAAEAVTAHARSVELHPNAPLLLINLGQAMLATEDHSQTQQAIGYINRAVALENDNPLAWRLLSEAYDQQGNAGMARLAAAEQNFALGQAQQARIFAMRAREILPPNTPQWRRATDIVLVSNPSPDDLRSVNGPPPHGLVAPRAALAH